MADNEFLYQMNDTMKLLGHQCMCGFKGIDMLEDVFNAHRAKRTNNYHDVAIDAFALGYIMGKRAERARKRGRSSENGR